MGWMEGDLEVAKIELQIEIVSAETKTLDKWSMLSWDVDSATTCCSELVDWILCIRCIII